MKTGKEHIAEERQRQKKQKGILPADDAHFQKGELIRAALAYEAAASWVVLTGRMPEKVPDNWPWEESIWKPEGGPIRMLSKAGALYQAEIDRLEFLNRREITAYADALIAVKRCAARIDYLQAGQGILLPASSWPLGKKLEGKVCEVYPGKEPERPILTFVVAEDGEGYLMPNVLHDFAPSTGMQVIIEFCHCTAIGNHWKIVDLMAAPAA